MIGMRFQRTSGTGTGAGGKAMIATLRRRLIAVPGRLIRHARHLICSCRPATASCPGSWPGCGTCPPCLTCAS